MGFKIKIKRGTFIFYEIVPGVETYFKKRHHAITVCCRNYLGHNINVLSVNVYTISANSKHIALPRNLGR